jgi:chromate transporter
MLHQKLNSNNKNLLEIAKVFLKLGSISFGGPAAHTAMMEEEIVRKRKWITHSHFLDLLGATNIIPGPNSTEMTMHCGYEKGGWKGLFVAGLAFIIPAVLITLIFAVLYEKFGQLPAIEPFIYGIKPAVIAIILVAVINLGKKALKNVEIGVLGVLTLIACLLGVNEIIALFACGLMGILLNIIKNLKQTFNSFAPFALIPFTALISQVNSFKIFLIFLKIGAILYGSGYVLFAFLDSELVTAGLLSRQQLIDSVAVGQFTPGPLLSTATFIGYQMNGIWGALAATLGVFLPSFIFVLILNPIIPKLRKSKILASFLDAVNIAAIALIIAVVFEMSTETITNWKTTLIAVISFALVLAFKKVNSALIVIFGSIFGYLLYLI